MTNFIDTETSTVEPAPTTHAWIAPVAVRTFVEVIVAIDSTP